MKQRLAVWTGLFLAAAATAVPAALVFKWVDGHGNVTYHERPPPDGSEYTVEEKEFVVPFMTQTEKDLRKVVKNHPVVLYVIKGCDSCDLARKYLQDRKVPFTEKNVEKDPALQKEVMEKAGSLTVPVITVGDKVMNGYVRSLLESELNAAGYPEPKENPGLAAGHGTGEEKKK